MQRGTSSEDHRSFISELQKGDYKYRTFYFSQITHNAYGQPTYVVSFVLVCKFLYIFDMNVYRVPSSQK